MPGNATLERHLELGHAPLVVLPDHEQKVLPTLERQPRMVAQLVPLVAVPAAQVATLGRLHDPMNKLRCGRWMPESVAQPGRGAPRLACSFHFASAFLVSA